MYLLEFISHTPDTEVACAHNGHGTLKKKTARQFFRQNVLHFHDKHITKNDIITYLNLLKYQIERLCEISQLTERAHNMKCHFCFLRPVVKIGMYWLTLQLQNVMLNEVLLSDGRVNTLSAPRLVYP